MIDAIFDGFRIYTVLLSVSISVLLFRFCTRTTRYKGFSMIGAIVPLEWVLFYALRALDALEPIALNAMSILITAETLTFMLVFILFVGATMDE